MAPRRVIVSVDLPAALLRQVDRLARRKKRSRPQIIGAAVAHCFAGHTAAAVTEPAGPEYP